VRKAKKQRTDYPSTNVSSPVRAPKQKKIQQYAYHEDEDNDDDTFAPPRYPIGKQQNARGYVEDGFVVGDNDLDNDFAPVREAKTPKTSKTGKSKGIGAPITNDDRLAELSPAQIDTIFKYVDIARDLRGTIMVQKGHRTAIFSDTIIREMGLELPRDLEEMRRIPGIRVEMVDLYGKRFLPLIQKTRRHYGEEVPNRRHLDEEVQDPNHCNVVNLCSSDAEEETSEAEAESNHSFSDDGEDGQDYEDDDEVHFSHHFNQQQDPDVAAFNERMSQLGTAVPKAASTSRAPRGGSKAPGGKKGRGFRKSGSGSGKSHAGVKKRATKASGSQASGGATKKTTSGNRRSGASGGGWGGIMAMPT
jgi:bloom syndrome protein